MTESDKNWDDVTLRITTVGDETRAQSFPLLRTLPRQDYEKAIHALNHVLPVHCKATVHFHKSVREQIE